MKTLNLLCIMFIFTMNLKAQDFEKEIMVLKSPEQIKEYWDELKLRDQAHRGLDTKDTNDNNNYKKSILLIKHHGFPFHNKMPFVIAVHQQSRNVNEFYFPIFYKAYKEGLVDTFWFFHYVRGLYSKRFGRDLVRGRNIEPADIDTFMLLLKPYLNFTLDYSVNHFDSLHEVYKSELKEITSSEIIEKWKDDDNNRVYFYRYKSKIYYLKLWADNSCSFPQEIIYNPIKKQYDFLITRHDDYLMKWKDKLMLVQEGKVTEMYMLDK